MDPTTLSFPGFEALFALMILRVPMGTERGESLRRGGWWRIYCA